MKIVFIIIIFIILLVFLVKFRNKREERFMLEKLDKYKLKGFPIFSKKEQLEMIYSGDFQMINKRLNMKVVPTTCFREIFSITKSELKSYIENERDILKDRDIELNQEDGIWLEKKENKYFIRERERGRLCSSKKFTKKDDVVKYFTNVLFSVILNEGNNSLHTFIIKK